MTASLGESGALNSNMPSDYKPEVDIWSKQHMRRAVKNLKNRRKIASRYMKNQNRWLHL